MADRSYHFYFKPLCGSSELYSFLTHNSLLIISDGGTAYDSTNATFDINIGTLKDLLDINPNIKVSINDKLTVSSQRDREFCFALLLKSFPFG
jgi:hypothetical protein